MLKRDFYKLCLNYSNNLDTIDNLYLEIVSNYSNKNRYYHTLEHLSNLLQELQDLSLNKKDREIFKFATFYHDIIYNPKSNTNEEDSANFAKKSLKKLKVSKDIIEDVYSLILLTKSHQSTQNPLYSLFLDADISIVGYPEDKYFDYSQNVAKEYSFLDKNIYIIGRKKFIKGLLLKENIFQTAHFQKKYESQAKQNLQRELQKLSS